MSVVHFVLKRHPTFSEPVRSKVCFSMWLCSSVSIKTQLVSGRPGFESRRSLNFFTLLLLFKCWNCSSPATTIALRELSSISPWKKIQCNPNCSIWLLAICVNFHVSKYLRSSTLMYFPFLLDVFPSNGNDDKCFSLHLIVTIAPMALCSLPARCSHKRPPSTFSPLCTRAMQAGLFLELSFSFALEQWCRLLCGIFLYKRLITSRKDWSFIVASEDLRRAPFFPSIHREINTRYDYAD